MRHIFVLESKGTEMRPVTIFGFSLDSVLWKFTAGKWKRTIRPSASKKGHRAIIINTLLRGRPETKYLEIGLDFGRTFADVRAAARVGVDPVPKFNLSRLPPGATAHAQTSDEFFAEVDQQATFDVIFLDGLHEWGQTYRDFVNSLNHLKNRGFVVIDDVVPIDSFAAIPDQRAAYETRLRESGQRVRAWQGDVFRALKKIADQHPEVAFALCGPQESPVAVLWVADGTESDMRNAKEEDFRYGDYSFEDFCDWRMNDPRLFTRGLDEVDNLRDTRDLVP